MSNLNSISLPNFPATATVIDMRNNDLHRRIYTVSKAVAYWDAVPEARLAMEQPRHPGIVSYVEVKITGRGWKLSNGRPTMTVRIRFIGLDSCRDWFSADVVAANWSDEARAEAIAAIR